MVEALLTEHGVSRALDIDLGQAHWGQITEFLCECFYRTRFREALPEVPSDALWQQLTDEKYPGPLSPHPQQEKAINQTVPVPFVQLEQLLLSLGGTRLVYRHEPHLQPLLLRGEVLDGPVELVPGEERNCHSNSTRLWQENKETLALATGYALSEDGLWRQHSWVIRKQPDIGQARILETTILRVKYFGFLLNDAEAEAFAESE